MKMITWLIEDGHAKAERHAENIIALLKLHELWNEGKFDEIKERVKLYEAWKTSGMYKKTDRAACAMKAIAGEPVPAVDMFEADFENRERENVKALGFGQYQEVGDTNDRR